MIEYTKYFDSSMTMSFKVNDKMLLKSILKYGEKQQLNWSVYGESVYGLFIKDKNKTISG